MKTAVFIAPGQKLSIETRADPVPGDGQVVLRVGRCGICGSDLHMTESHDVLPSGAVLGHEFAGEVMAVGKHVETLKIGDRVSALPLHGCGRCESCRAGNFTWCTQFQFTSGGFAEYVLSAAHACLKLPDILSLEDGALVEPMAVSRHALAMAAMPSRADVVVLGAGPIGLAAIYWAKRMGAGRVVAIAASRRREALAMKMGADAFVVNDEHAPEWICTAFDGVLADVVVECVGLPGMLPRSIELAKPRGTVIVAGACVQPDAFVPLTAMLKELRMQFSIMYGLADFQASIDALDAGGVEVRDMVHDTIAMDAFPDAFEALRIDKAPCKVMLDPWR